MQIFIMRHGDAALQAASDAQRALTQQGQQECRQMARWLMTQNAQPQQVLVSPYRRALQTLEIVAETAKEVTGGRICWADTPQINPALTPAGDVLQISQQLQTLAGDGVASVLIISHLPLVGYLVAELCPQQSPPMFATSAISCVTLCPSLRQQTATGVHNWHMTPSQLTTLTAAGHC